MHGVNVECRMFISTSPCAKPFNIPVLSKKVRAIITKFLNFDLVRYHSIDNKIPDFDHTI